VNKTQNPKIKRQIIYKSNQKTFSFSKPHSGDNRGEEGWGWINGMDRCGVVLLQSLSIFGDKIRVIPLSP